jgi:two-component system nitrogen regulation response regulator NtrX
MDRATVMVGISPAIRAVEEEIQYAARSDAKVLITGESGVGKEIVARLIHQRSARGSGPLVTINCAGFPDSLLESEMFGHVKGSFTDAHRDKRGWLEMAHGGTIFMDEVGEMSLRMQALMLRFLETGEIQRVGSERQTAALNVRVITATHRRLLDRIADKTFREDLYYRLNVVPLHVPPLRERREDIPLLAQHSVNVLTSRDGAAARTLDPSAVDALGQMEWQGNVRELRNTIERLLILAPGPRITAADVGRLSGARPADGSPLGALLDLPRFEEFKDAAERAYLLHKLRGFNWNVSETARAIDMPRSNLYKKIERYGLERET